MTHMTSVSNESKAIISIEREAEWFLDSTLLFHEVLDSIAHLKTFMQQREY